MTEFDTLSSDEKLKMMEKVARSALGNWALSADSRLDLLGYRENAVFKVSTPAGEQYAMRVHRHDYHTADQIKSDLEKIAPVTVVGAAPAKPEE